MHWYQYTKNQIESEMKVSAQKGLPPEEVRRRFLQYGPNTLPDQPPESYLMLFARQFKSPLIYILFVCSGIVFYLGDEADSVIILAVLVFNALIGCVQEGRSQQTLNSLKKLSNVETAVLRGGREEVVGEAEIVPGDILILQEGQKVVADARVIHSSSLSCDEAPLTGESGGVHKTDGNLMEESLSPAAQKNMVFKGTNVLTGNGLAVVVSTGLLTELGKISRAVAGEQTEIPLQKKIRRLSTVIIYAVIILCGALFALGLYYGRTAREMFGISVSLAVSMIPEGLPLVLTLILVSGVWRMSKKRALVKKLAAVEALGQAKILAVDKTGTLTKNEMVVKQIFTDGKILQVSGNGYQPSGGVTLGGQPVNFSQLQLVAKIAALGSRATVRFVESEGTYKVAGDPTEAAMATLAEKLHQPREKWLESYKETAEIPFDYKTKFRAVFYKEPGDGIFCAIVGAPEALIEQAKFALADGQETELNVHRKKELEKVMENFSSRGLRVVAFGYKILPAHNTQDNISNLVIAGLFAIEDSLRPEAREAINLAGEAGVKVVMITGDHKITARAIATEAGIFKEGDEILTGAELDALQTQEIDKKIAKVSVFARVTPADKMKIIKAYRRAHLTVAMTGDGVNDAPSLTSADLGVAMGKIGTEVAKEAADIVLMDDNLGSIVAAIEEGRNMYKNIQKALMFLFSTSLGELFAIAGALLLHMPMPVLAVQILWMNLVTDPLIGTALALEKKENNLLRKQTHQLPEYFITNAMLVQMFVVGAVMAAGALYLFKLNYAADYSRALTISLTALVVYQWYNGFNCRNLTDSILNRKIFANPYLLLAIAANFLLQYVAVSIPFMQKVLKTTPLSLMEWLTILTLCVSVIVAVEVVKAASRLISYKNRG